MKLSVFGLSDIGVSRPNNEDVWIAIPEIGFFALADGMGGHQAGEVAAKEAIDHLSNSVKQIESCDPLSRMLELKSAIEKANGWVYQLSKEEETLHGMGTTLCCLIWAEDAVIYAHVGDSRIYRFRNRKLELLTQDHSLFAKWLKAGKQSHTPFPYKNVITRAIGTAPKANPEVAICRHEEGDLYFLCTDGLTDVLTLDDIEKILHESATLEIASKTLIDKAKFKGSSDNITILMVQCDGDGRKNLFRQQRDDAAGPEGIQSDALGSERSPSESF
ncbi:MAG: protein phosphatase 2C domain-containing protein [Parachlamydiales bacterium]|nr:protein phosphatase 2C domain-containing protein [Parachlamydiales bacterium]